MALDVPLQAGLVAELLHAVVAGERVRVEDEHLGRRRRRRRCRRRLGGGAGAGRRVRRAARRARAAAAVIRVRAGGRVRAAGTRMVGGDAGRVVVVFVAAYVRLLRRSAHETESNR